ncbi:MAG: 3'-5' exoribonuclease YhaM family protein [Anaerovoracaceae bacterium]
MKEFYIANFKVDEEIVDFFIIKTIAVKLGSNKKQYLDLLLADSTGEITAKKWDLADTELPAVNEIKEGDIVKIKAVVTQWNGLKQLKVLRIRKKVEDDPIELMDLIKAAPEKAEDMYRYIYDRAERMEDEDLKKICIHYLEKNREKLMYYPAAQKNHHAQLAGLLYHIKRMLMNGDLMCRVYTNLRADLVAAGVILHDMEKINEIDSNELGVSTGYFVEGTLLGHIVQGVRNIEAYAKENGMDHEKAMMLEHMILSHHYEPEFGSPKKPMFPEAEILHYLDIIDARMFDMEDALQGVEPGDFSDRVWTLDNRRIYKAVWNK